MGNEQLYIFVDKSKHCFRGFADVQDDTDYHKLVAVWLMSGRKFIVGDMMCFKDELEEAGFKWGIDYYVQKVK